MLRRRVQKLHIGRRCIIRKGLTGSCAEMVLKNSA